MAHIKGIRFLPHWTYLRENDPGGVRDCVLDAVEPELARDLRAGVDTQRWYPVSVYASFLRRIDEHLGCGDLTLIRELGRISARESFTGAFRMFFKAGSPAIAMSSAPIIWRRLFDAGRIELELESLPDGKRYHMFVLDFDEGEKVREVVVRLLEGWVEAGLEMTGARRVRVERVLPPSRPDAWCELCGAWETGGAPRRV